VIITIGAVDYVRHHAHRSGQGCRSWQSVSEVSTMLALASMMLYGLGRLISVQMVILCRYHIPRRFVCEIVQDITSSIVEVKRIEERRGRTPHEERPAKEGVSRTVCSFSPFLFSPFPLISFPPHIP
jgi:hypothetical protein